MALNETWDLEVASITLARSVFGSPSSNFFCRSPAVFWLLARAPRLIRLREDSLAEGLLLTALLGLMLTAFISLGELRFRIPFDGFLIILAAQTVLALVNREQRQINLIGLPPVLSVPGQ
mgnify:CR=1 FL=1